VLACGLECSVYDYTIVNGGIVVGMVEEPVSQISTKFQLSNLL
jgi:hypothetical protein